MTERKREVGDSMEQLHRDVGILLGQNKVVLEQQSRLIQKQEEQSETIQHLKIVCTELKSTNEHLTKRLDEALPHVEDFAKLKQRGIGIGVVLAGLFTLLGYLFERFYKP